MPTNNKKKNEIAPPSSFSFYGTVDRCAFRGRGMDSNATINSDMGKR
jgi:hypothetical protein